MTPDLNAFLFPADVVQPEWLTKELLQLVKRLGAASEEEWLTEIWKFRFDSEVWIIDGSLTGNSAACVRFIGVALEAAFQAEGKPGAALVLGFGLQLTFSPGEWQDLMAAAPDDGTISGEKENGPVRLDSFLDAVILYFAKRQRLDVLRNMFSLVHHAIDDVARQAMRDAKDFETWVGRLAILGAHLILRRWLPLKLRDDSEDDTGHILLTSSSDGAPRTGKFIAPARPDNPILQVLFNANEIATLHRREAYASECFAHLYTSVRADLVTKEGQARVAEEYRVRLDQDRIAARQWLALGKSRFEIAPYLN